MQRGMKIVLGGWTAFAGTHLVMSHPPVREKLIEVCGDEKRFRFLYSAVAGAILVPGTIAYLRTPAALKGAQIHSLVSKPWARRTSGLMRALGAVMVADSILSPVRNPTAMNPNASDDEPTDARQLSRKYQVYGLQRATRHGLFLGLSLISAGMVLVRPRAADAVLWALVPVFNAVGAWHQDYRQRATKPAHWYRETSAIPFAKMVTGEQSMGKMLSEITPAAYSVGFVVAGMIFIWP